MILDLYPDHRLALFSCSAAGDDRPGQRRLMESIGERLRQARLKAGIKQESAAIEMGMNRSTLAAIEADRRAVLARELPGFAKLYDMTLKEILFGNGTELTTEKETENMNNENLAAAPDITESDDKAVLELLTDYDQIKEKLTMEVVSADRNEEMLSEFRQH